MEGKPKVSFIMPAYNVADYISEAIESVCAQTEREWELLIIDDCSEDETLEIAKHHAAKDSRIRVIESDAPSGGAYTPRKRGIMEARSEIVSPIDADDFIPVDYLEKMLKTMESRGADAVYPMLYRWNGVESRLISSPAEELLREAVSGRASVRFTLEGWHIHCGGGLIRRENYIKSFPMVVDSEIMSQQDELLTRILLYNCAAVTIADVPYFYRDNPGSITKKKDFRTFGFLINNQRLISFIRTHYSVDSEEWMKIQRQNFHGIFDALRLIPQCALSRDERSRVMQLIKNCREDVDYSVIKGKVSPRYYLLSKLPLSVLGFLFRTL